MEILLRGGLRVFMAVYAALLNSVDEMCHGLVMLRFFRSFPLNYVVLVYIFVPFTHGGTNGYRLINTGKDYFVY